MPSQAPAPPKTGHLVARANGARSTLLTLAAEVARLSGRPAVAVPGPVTGGPGRSLVDTLANLRLAALDLKGQLATAGQSSTANVGSGQPPLTTGYAALAAGLDVLIADVGAAIDGTGQTGSGIQTIVLIKGGGASLDSGSAETAEGEDVDGGDPSDGNDFADPAADARVWLDGAWGPVDDPNVGTGIRVKQGSYYPALASRLSLGYRSPGGQPVRVRILAISKGSALRHVSKFTAPNGTTSLGFGSVSDPDSLWAYAVAEYPDFIAAVRAEPGYDPRYETRVAFTSWGNEAEWIRESPDPADPREISETQLRAQFASLPDQFAEAFGEPLDHVFLLPTGGPPREPEIPALHQQRAAEFGGIADAVAAGHSMHADTDRLREIVLLDAATFPDRYYIEDYVHMSRVGNVEVGVARADGAAAVMGLPPAD